MGWRPSRVTSEDNLRHADSYAYFAHAVSHNCTEDELPTGGIAVGDGGPGGWEGGYKPPPATDPERRKGVQTTPMSIGSP